MEDHPNYLVDIRGRLWTRYDVREDLEDGCPFSHNYDNRANNLDSLTPLDGDIQQCTLSDDNFTDGGSDNEDLSSMISNNSFGGEWKRIVSNPICYRLDDHPIMKSMSDIVKGEFILTQEGQIYNIDKKKIIDFPRYPVAKLVVRLKDYRVISLRRWNLVSY